MSTSRDLPSYREHPPEDEARLIERSRQGDAAAFTQLVALHQARVRAYVAGTIGRPDVVDDLAQEVFLAAFSSLDKYKPDAPLGFWLLGIARHKVLLYLRQEVRRWSRERKSMESVLVPLRLAFLEGGGDAELPQREREITALQRCLDSLPADGAALISGRYFQGRSVADMARELGKREGAIRMTLLRLRQLLRSCVDARLDGEGA